MPVIRVEYDNAIVSEAEASLLCDTMQKVVAEATNIEDVFVYGNSSHIKVAIAPIEAWVEMSADKVGDAEVLAGNIRTALGAWKDQTDFPHPINLTLIPMNWRLELGI